MSAGQISVWGLFLKLAVQNQPERTATTSVRHTPQARPRKKRSTPHGSMGGARRLREFRCASLRRHPTA
jgi:hypothetical protein